MGLTSQHFSESELACHHCQLNGVVQEILDALEAFRLLVGSHVLLDSAYRCPVWNRLEGGALRSQHMLGKAADVRVTGKTARELYEIALQVPQIRGLGVADNQQFLHLDVRETVQLAKWCYSLEGSEVPWHEFNT